MENYYMEYTLLNKLNNGLDIKSLNNNELVLLSKEIRHFLIDKVSKKGGHIASNLGIVELTIALFRSFNLPKDKIIYDVGHQSYVHKLLSGRMNEFDTLRDYNGLSGFPKREESKYDSFNTGHSSTSISAGLGMVKARDLNSSNDYIVSVIGDGSLTGGMAYEALNNAAELNTNFIIILNDNNMSIDKNVGGLKKYLDSIRTSNQYNNLKQNIKGFLSKLPGGKKVSKGIHDTKNSIKQLVVPGMLFENMGIKYLGPVNGYNINELQSVIKDAKKVKGPVIVHVLTTKGKGYKPAEDNPTKFHGIGPFDVKSGQCISKSSESYTKVFATKLTKLAAANPKLLAITAAMPDGTGLNMFKQQFPNRFIDVGIAEEHGVTFSAGLATYGYIPVFAVYSSFLQRGFDQIIHDCALQNLHVVFAIDRAGIVGRDGETHQGLFDINYLTMIPNMCVMAPKNKFELEDMLEFAVDLDCPVSIRYGRGEASSALADFKSKISLGVSETIYNESDICLIAIGSMVEEANKVYLKLKESNYKCSLINLRFAKPLDTQMLDKVSNNHKLIVTIEEGILSGGVGSMINTYFSNNNIKVKTINIGINDSFVVSGDRNVLLSKYGIDADSIYNRIINEFN